MSGKIKKVLCLLLCASVFASFGVTASAAVKTNEAERTLKIENPYKDVVWKGENAWTAYKGNLHTHSTYSDADVSLKEMVMEYYNQGFGFLGMADHAVTGIEWNQAPAKVWIYQYHKLLGDTVEHLTDDEYKQVTAGTYPMPDGLTRNYGLTCVTGANELNALTLTKCHVVAYDLPSDIGNGHGGVENGQREAVEFADENGGYSVIAHPGDWLESNKNFENVYDEDNVDYFSKIFLDYDSCLGMEVFNETNNATPYDRNLWDNILMQTLPYGRNVLGFANSDAHVLKNVDSTFSVFMMQDNTSDSVRRAMHEGTFFAVTRKIHANPVLGPEETFNVIDQRFPYPMATNISVRNDTITMNVENATKVQWIANGKIVATTSVDSMGTSTIDLSEIEGSEDFLYVRAEIFGDGGCCMSQPFVIDNGSEKLDYETDTSLSAKLDYMWYRFKSNRLFIIIQEVVRIIKR